MDYHTCFCLRLVIMNKLWLLTFSPEGFHKTSLRTFLRHINRCRSLRLFAFLPFRLSYFKAKYFQLTTNVFKGFLHFSILAEGSIKHNKERSMVTVVY